MKIKQEIDTIIIGIGGVLLLLTFIGIIPISFSPFLGLFFLIMFCYTIGQAVRWHLRKLKLSKNKLNRREK